MGMKYVVMVRKPCFFNQSKLRRTEIHTRMIIFKKKMACHDDSSPRHCTLPYIEEKLSRPCLYLHVFLQGVKKYAYSFSSFVLPPFVLYFGFSMTRTTSSMAASVPCHVSNAPPVCRTHFCFCLPAVDRVGLRQGRGSCKAFCDSSGSWRLTIWQS